MQKKQNLNPKQYTDLMSQLSGMKVTNVIHTQDSMLNIELELSDKKITLIIDGDWNIQQNLKLKLTSQPKKNQSDSEYYNSLRELATLLKNDVTKLINIQIEQDLKNAVITFNKNWKLSINQNEFGLLSYKNENNQEYLILSISDNQKTDTYLEKV
jgi:hypothetical protein